MKRGCTPGVLARLSLRAQRRGSWAHPPDTDRRRGSTHRSLFVVLDSLTCTDGAISAAAQGWLVRALSLGDVARILEPVLLLLLQPKTQRTSIHCLKQENAAGERALRGHQASSGSQSPGPRRAERASWALGPRATAKARRPAL